MEDDLLIRAARAIYQSATLCADRADLSTRLNRSRAELRWRITESAAIRAMLETGRSAPPTE